MARGDGIDRTNARNMRLTATKIGRFLVHQCERNRPPGVGAVAFIADAVLVQQFTCPDVQPHRQRNSGQVTVKNGYQLIDTLQKVREMGSEAYSYADDYQIVGKLKQFADRNGLCLLVVHHTRKQPSGDKFEMISGTTGLLGCADTPNIRNIRSCSRW